MRREHFRIATWLVAILGSMALASCSGSGSSSAPGSAAPTPTGTLAEAAGDPIANPATLTPFAVGTIPNPILFVTQVPVQTDFASRASTFANHLADPESVPRGGDLMIRYPDGTIRNLTKEAGFGTDGQQGAGAIAVREPSVHWSGAKAVFSMVVGAPARQFEVGTYRWQIYEVTGLEKGETARVRAIPGQPAGYNNVSPFYGTDERILFTSDRPRNGAAHLYPQLDEYESTPTVTGIWSLDPVSADLRLLNHTPSGVFSPSIDTYGRVVFVRWDHRQRDQQADADRVGGSSGSFNVSDESAGATRLGLLDEVFPESRTGQTSAYGPVVGWRNNVFMPWQINEDGSGEETLNHVGQQEFGFGFIGKSFVNDPALSDYPLGPFRANTKFIRSDGGLFHLREDLARPGSYVAIYAREFGSLSSNQIVRFNGGLGTNPESMAIVDVTATAASDGSVPGGRYRNPLPLASGTLVATHTPTTAASPADIRQFRLRVVDVPATGPATAGMLLTPGIQKSVTWWSPDAARSFSGTLWELEAVEVVARRKPAARRMPSLESPESAVFAEVGVDERAFRDWLASRDLALIVTRNQTSRDRADAQQPINLRVAGGTETLSGRTGPVYSIAHYQIFQANQVRGYDAKPGRRVLAMPTDAVAAGNPANAGGPAGSVRIAADGSTAAIVPARRALTWQSTDASGEAVVRERIWATFQPGEVRVCASCHGVNTADQAGRPEPTHKPEALRALLNHWKTLPR
ncbi:MAG: hypothetical protein O9972_57625 [Burkholderiales bacterium]|nr:hypothetical protein [Burkholderiales bacterium]